MYSKRSQQWVSGGFIGDMQNNYFFLVLGHSHIQPVCFQSDMGCHYSSCVEEQPCEQHAVQTQNVDACNSLTVPIFRGGRGVLVDCQIVIVQGIDQGGFVEGNDMCPQGMCPKMDGTEYPT